MVETIDRLQVFEDTKKLVGHIIFKHFYMFSEYQDELFQEGYLQLLKAIDHHDPSKGFKVSTLAYKYIYYGLQEYIDVKIKGYKRRKYYKNGISQFEIIKPQFIYIDKANKDTEKDSKKDFDYHNCLESPTDKDIEYKQLTDDIYNYLYNIEKKKTEVYPRSVYSNISEIFKYLATDEYTLHEIGDIVGLKYTAIHRKLVIIRELVSYYLRGDRNEI